MTRAILKGKPDAEKPHVRFDEGKAVSYKPRRGSLLYMYKCSMKAVGCLVTVVGSATSLCAAHDSTERIDVWETNRVETGSIDSGYLDLRGGSWTQAGGSSYFNVQSTVGLGGELVYENKVRKQELNVTDGEFVCRRLVAGLANSWTYPAEVNVTGGTLKSHCFETDPTSENWGAYGLSMAPRSYGNTTPPAYWETTFPAARLTIDGGLVKFPALVFGTCWRNDADLGIAAQSTAQIRLRGGAFELGGGGVRINYWDDTASYYDFNLSGGTLKLNAAGEVAVRTHLSSANGGATIEVPSGSSSTMKSEIYGTGSLKKTGAGTLILGNIGAYTGRTEVSEGALYVRDPSNDAIWTGDCFANTASGTEVTAWTNTHGKSTWSFGYNGSLVNSQHGPSVAATTLNGHPTLAFDGQSSLFLTGVSAQPASDSAELTFVAVVKIPAGTVGAASEDWIKATVIAGTSYQDPGKLRYGLAVDDAGKVGFGTSYAQDATGGAMTETIWSDAAINDGEAHVIIGTWQQAVGYSLTVDGVRKTSWATQMKTSKTIQTRFILGGSEQNKSALFIGELADLRLIPRVYAKGEAEMLTKRLQARYGLAPAAAPVTMPTPTAVWSADDLAGEAGTSVTSWKVGNWDFTSSLADAVLKSCKSGYVTGTAPKIAADKVNGHKLVSFNGTSDALGLTGNADTPVSGADGLSMAFAVRFTGLGRGIPTAHIGMMSIFFGEGYLQVGNTVQTFGLGYTSCGMAHAGHYCCRIDGGTSDGWGTTRSQQAFLDDGEIHILVATWPKISEAADKIYLSVDGSVSSVTAKMRNTILKSRLLLGASEWQPNSTDTVARYVPIDVAEFRIFKNTVLTADQIKQLTAEMAAKYGVQMVQDRQSAGEFSKSKDVLVQSGATYGAQDATDCFEISGGQTVDCRGTLQGRPVVRAGGALMTGADAALTVNGLELEDGAVLRVRSSADGTIQPIAVNGDLRLPNGTVKVDVSGCSGKVPSGRVLTWTGNLVKSGTTQFEVIGSGTARFSEANKWLKVGASGLLLFVR